MYPFSPFRSLAPDINHSEMNKVQSMSNDSISSRAQFGFGSFGVHHNSTAFLIKTVDLPGDLHNIIAENST